MKQNLFDFIPVIGEHITTEKEGELSVITFPRFRSKLMQKYFIPKNKSPKIHIRLDEHGTAVWDLIDGNRTIKMISETLTDRFNNEENYEYRIAIFFSHLYKQGFVRYKR